MSPIQQYVFLRQAGLAHDEAVRLINRGVIPRLTTEMKRVAVQRILNNKAVKKS